MNFKKIINGCLLIILLFFLIVLSFSSCNSNTFKNQEKYFSISDTSVITRIDIIQKGKRVILLKSGNNWTIKSFIANQNYVDYLLKILTKIEIHSKVSENEANIIRDVYDTIKTEVIIYKKRRKIKDFFLYPNTNSESCYAMNAKNKQVYTIYIPGYQYKLLPVFNTSLNHWMDKELVDFYPDEIKSVTFIFGNKPENSFRLINKGSRNYEIYSNPLQENTLESFETEKVERYLGYFRNIKFYEYLEDSNYSIFDSIKKSPYEYYLLIENKDEIKELKTYPIYIQKTINVLGDTLNIDPYQCYILDYSDSSVYIVKYTEFDPVIKRINYFLTL